jgi:hypothetical protein
VECSGHRVMHIRIYKSDWLRARLHWHGCWVGTEKHFGEPTRHRIALRRTGYDDSVALSV